MENIAKIRLAPGKVGFYDPLSNIHLTLGSPEAYVPSGTNCAALRRNFRNGLIELKEGTLGGDIAPFKVEKTKDGNFHLVSNAQEENKPIFKEQEVSASHVAATEKPNERNISTELPKASRDSDAINLPPTPTLPSSEEDDDSSKPKKNSKKKATE